MRVTNAPASRKRRIRTIKDAKGFRMRRSKLYRYAADALDHGRQYAFRHRKTKKRDYRALWQVRINAAARAMACADLQPVYRGLAGRQRGPRPQGPGRSGRDGQRSFSRVDQDGPSRPHGQGEGGRRRKSDR